MERSAIVLIYALAITAVFISASMAEADENNTLNSVFNSSKNTKPSTTTNATANITSNLSADLTSNLPVNIISSLTLHRTENATAVSTLNETENAARTSMVLRVGSQRAKPIEALGGQNSSNLSGRNLSSSISSISSIHSSMQTGRQLKSAFNLSQRVGSVSRFTANTTTTPFFNANQYTRTKPIYEYEAPDNSSREVYNTSGYPEIMLPNSIP